MTLFGVLEVSMEDVDVRSSDYIYKTREEAVKHALADFVPDNFSGSLRNEIADDLMRFGEFTVESDIVKKYKLDYSYSIQLVVFSLKD